MNILGDKYLNNYKDKIKEIRYNNAVRKQNIRAKLEDNAVYRGAINSLFPLDFTCNVCGKEMINPSKSGLCPDCEKNLRYNDGDICLVCGRPHSSETDYCLECQNNERVFEFSRSPLIYDGIAKDLIWKFKFFNARYLAKYFCQLMADTYNKFPYKTDVVVSVPISKSRLITRGYNQSELLAKGLSNMLGLDFQPDGLVKIKDTPDQVGLTKAERMENLDKAFVANKEIVKGKNVLLIDDVLTTGSTANECAKSLLKVGATNVQVLVIATVEQKVYSV